MADAPSNFRTEGMAQARGALGGILRGDVVLALGIIAILVFMLIPIPTWLLDMGLSISILFSVFIESVGPSLAQSNHTYNDEQFEP